MIPTILEDPREIERITLATFYVEVGSHGVTKIVAYAEPGQMERVPFLAVYVGDHLNDRVPAYMAVVTYKEPPK